MQASSSAGWDIKVSAGGKIALTSLSQVINKVFKFVLNVSLHIHTRTIRPPLDAERFL